MGKTRSLASPSVVVVRYTTQMVNEVQCDRSHNGDCTRCSGNMAEGQAAKCPRLGLGSAVRRGCLEEMLPELDRRAFDICVEVGDG